MKQSISFSMLVSALMLTHSLFAAQSNAPQVINAWYGAENNKANISGPVVNKLRDVVSKYGFIVIPAEQNKFYGTDPIPGVRKTTAIHVKYNGKEEHLRAPEGADFVYPANTDKAKVQNALSALKVVAAAPAPAAKPAPAPAPAAKPVSASKPNYITVELPIPAQQIEQEVIKAGATWEKSAKVTASLLLPAANGSKGAIIVSGIIGAQPPANQRLYGRAFVIKFANDAQGAYHPDPSFGKNITGRAWKVSNGIVFIEELSEEWFHGLGYRSTALTPGNKPNEFLLMVISNLAPQGDSGIEILMNGHGDIIKSNLYVPSWAKGK